MIIFLLFFVRKRAVTTTALSVYITTPFGEAPRRKDTYSVSHNFSHVKSGLYSDIQDLQNGLAALDTRVTNAITGGDLAAPYTLNFLNTPYTNVGANPYSDPDYKTIFTTSTPTAWAATQPKGSSGYSATVYRKYQTTVKIGKNYKLKYNFSGTYSDAMGEGLSLLLCEGGTVLQKIKASGSGNTHTASGELDLSLYVGKTVNIKFMVVTWTGYGFSAAFNTLSITNK